MSKQLNREEAWALLTEYNQDPFHLHHARTVEGVMRYFAQELGYGDEVDFWGIVGLLHDLDFERYPDQHCIKSQEIMREREMEEHGEKKQERRKRKRPATATASRWISSRSTRWKRYSLRPTS